MSRLAVGRTFHLILWSGLCGAYLLVSLPRILPGFAFGKLKPSEPYCSTDSYLQALTGAEHASSRILEALESLPPNKTIVLVLPDAGVGSAFIAQNVTYLCWPREVRWLTAKNGQAELYALSPSTLAAVLFWDVTPFAGLPNGIRLGAGQVLVPLRKTDAPGL